MKDNLSELLLACQRHPMNRKDVGLHCKGPNLWVAWARKTYLDDSGDGDRDCEGATPEEAVRKLLSELNK